MYFLEMSLVDSLIDQTQRTCKEDRNSPQRLFIWIQNKNRKKADERQRMKSQLPVMGGIQMDLGSIHSVVSSVILYVMGKQNGMQQM